MKKTQSKGKKYECLMILDTLGREEAEKSILDRLQKDFQQAGGKIETVQKMGQKTFARMIRGRTAGSYVNIIFSAPAKALRELEAKFHLDPDLFRWQFMVAPPPPIERKPRIKPESDAAAN